MLDVLRKNSRHWLVTAIIAVIIVGLAAFFGNSNRESARGSTWAVKIDGDAIKIGEFLNRYRIVVDNYRAKFGPSFDEKLLESLNIKSYILKALVDEKLAVKEALNNGIAVCDAELRENIQAYPAFQQNGVFNMDYYKKLLSYNRIKPTEFENMQRSELLRQKLRGVIYNSSKASNDEVMNAYRAENEKVRLEYVVVDKDAPTAAVSGDEVKKFLDSDAGKKETSDYYSEHNNEFMINSNGNSRIKMFSDVKEDIARSIIAKKKGASLNVSKIEDALKAGNIDAAARVLGQRPQITDMFSRKITNIPGMPSTNSNDVLWAFGLEKGRMYKREAGPRTYIAILKDRTLGSLDANKPEFEQYEQKFISEKGGNEFTSYMKELENKWKKKIEYSPYLLNDIRGGKEGVL